MTAPTIPAAAPTTRASQTDLMRDLARAIDHQALTPPTSIGFFGHENLAVSLRFPDGATTAVRHWRAYLELRGCTVVDEFDGPPFAHRGGVCQQRNVVLDALDGWRVSLHTVIDQPTAPSATPCNCRRRGGRHVQRCALIVAEQGGA